MFFLVACSMANVWLWPHLIEKKISGDRCWQLVWQVLQDTFFVGNWIPNRLYGNFSTGHTTMDYLVTNWSHMPPIFLNSLFFGNILLVIMMYSLTGQESWQSIWTKSVPNILGHKYCLETQRNQEESSLFRILLDFSIENFQQKQKNCPVGRFANFAGFNIYTSFTMLNTW